jgi:Reduced folate carrier
VPVFLSFSPSVLPWLGRAAIPSMYQYVKLKSFLSKNIVRGFCLFIALISFKPSEPYLSQYLVCNLSSLREACSTEDAQLCKIRSGTCRWNAVGSKCEIIPCNDITSKCDERQNYCTLDRSSGSCADTTCYKDFTESEVNDSIYPWSTYAYLPILLILGVAAELIGYRSAILIGISGRIATRFLLLYGTSLSDMQFMQVTYSLGSAAEDIFKAYVYTMVTQDRYQEATSYIATSALLSSIFAGIIGDSLVAVNDVSLRVLMVISACFVCIGAVVGFFVILPTQKPQQVKLSLGEIKDMMTYAFLEQKGRSAYKTIRISMHQLGLVLRIPAMRSLIVWWIIGNASYAVRL